MGRLVSSALHLPWLDLDHQIELSLGESISTFFQRCGEASFRDVETRCLEESVVLEPHIVSLGGGAILRDGNRRILREAGWTVWLQCSHKTLAERIGRDEGAGKVRPSLTGQDVVSEIEQVMRVREPLYRDAADWIVDVEGHAVDEVATRIVNWYRSFVS